MRMKLKKSGNQVTITYSDPITGEAESREFYVPYSGGYIRERFPCGSDKQVCESLSRVGSTLTAEPETLASVIRQEYNRLRRYEKKWLAA